MPVVDELARFVTGSRWEDVGHAAQGALKIRLLDAIGCAIGAQRGEPVRAIRAEIEEFGGAPLCSLVGGGRTAPDDAALYNAALVRYLDFNDSYLAKGETCHPSDNIAPVLAAAQYAGAQGRDALAAIAVAYQVQCRLSDEAPVRRRYFDHTTQGSYAVASGVARALGASVAQTANGIAIAGTALNALRVTRTSLSNWKGLAYPFTAFAGTRAAFLARRGITGPRAVLEGRKGFMEAIAGPFEIDWSSEGLDAVTRTIIKRFNAEIHAQSAIEAMLELRAERGFNPRDVDAIEVDTFDVSYSIIGGGDEGQKTRVATKEEADHSLPYMVAVALLDGDVLPAQYEPARISADDVRDLILKVRVRVDARYSSAFPDELGARVRVRLVGGTTLEREKRDYHGFHTRPMDWRDVTRKFDQLAGNSADDALRGRIAECVASLDERPVEDLLVLLEEVAADEPVATTRRHVGDAAVPGSVR